MKTSRAFTVLELLLFTAAVALLSLAYSPRIVRAWRESQTLRTTAIEEEVRLRKEQFFFEGTPEALEKFNGSDDQQRWELLRPKILREGKTPPDIISFLKGSGKTAIRIGADNQQVLLSR